MCQREGTAGAERDGDGDEVVDSGHVDQTRQNLKATLQFLGECAKLDNVSGGGLLPRMLFRDAVNFESRVNSVNCSTYVHVPVWMVGGSAVGWGFGMGSGWGQLREPQRDDSSRKSGEKRLNLCST